MQHTLPEAKTFSHAGWFEAPWTIIMCLLQILLFPLVMLMSFYEIGAMLIYRVLHELKATTPTKAGTNKPHAHSTS